MQVTLTSNWHASETPWSFSDFETGHCLCACDATFLTSSNSSLTLHHVPTPRTFWPAQFSPITPLHLSLEIPFCSRPGIFLFFLVWFRGHTFKGCSYFCTQELLLVACDYSGITIVMSEIESGSAVCKVNALPDVLLLQPPMKSFLFSHPWVLVSRASFLRETLSPSRALLNLAYYSRTFAFNISCITGSVSAGFCFPGSFSFCTVHSLCLLRLKWWLLGLSLSCLWSEPCTQLECGT